MLILFVTAIPLIGQIMILIWAIFGQNETRKNYCRAIILWFLILCALAVMITMIGAWPGLQDAIKQWRSGGR